METSRSTQLFCPFSNPCAAKTSVHHAALADRIDQGRSQRIVTFVIS
jgi:hypothetical protein